jgi:uncharacterized membrane protein (DUF106 family)
MVLYDILNPVLSPLLKIPSVVAIIALSFLLSLIITLVYKFTTNQDLMKRLKEEMKALQKDMKELSKDPEKAMAVQKQVMQANMKYMGQSMKSMIYTFIPIILIFGWMNVNFAYDPIAPGQDFTTTITFEKGIDGFVELSVPQGITINGDEKREIKDGMVTWVLSGNEGEYLLQYIINGKTYDKEVLISERGYKEPIEMVKDKIVKTIEVGNAPKKVLNLGFWKIGWLGTYIIFSIVFSMAIRKIIKVY